MNKIIFPRNYKQIGLLVGFVFCVSQFTFSQPGSLNNHIDLTFKDYLNKVISQNLEFTAEKYNVKIAESKIEAAKIFQDPYIAFDWGTADGDYTLTTEISKTFELGHKRRARINLANSESKLTEALLKEYFRNMRADATLDYMTALKQGFLYKVLLNSYQMVKQLADDDSIRSSLGSIKAIDATQSRIEAGILFNQLLQLETERNNSFVMLSNKFSTFYNDTLYTPLGNFYEEEKSFHQDELLITALNNRADLLVAKSHIEWNQDLLNRTQKERIADIDFKIGSDNTYLNLSNSFSSGTEIYSGFAIPLKFSNLNKAEIRIAQFQLKQSELLYGEVEINIQNEVLQAFNQYKSLGRQVANYNQGLLERAIEVLEGKIYSYSRGETSLLEVLNAQRTYNDLQISYYETLYNFNIALVEIERAVGIWDIDL